MKRLSVGKPDLDEREVKAVSEVLRSGWLTTGPEVEKLEQGICDYVGCRHAVAVNSATGGLHVALMALGVGPGDEVIVPSYTFAASAHVVVWTGAKPVFVDIEPVTYNIDPKKILKAITKKTKVILPVHFAGHACDMDSILKIAKSRKLRVVEDAAHAIGTDYKGKRIGSFGDIAVFSFYATKVMCTGEGGMIVTNDKALAEKMRTVSFFGIDRSAFHRYKTGAGWYYSIPDMGYKYNMDNIHGAIGVQQLKKIEGFIAKRRGIAAKYNSGLKGYVKTAPNKGYQRHTYYLYPILVKNRDKVMEILQQNGIGASVHFIPLHMQPYYKKALGYKKGSLPVTEEVYSHEISLPMHTKLSAKDVDFVIKTIRGIDKRWLGKG